MSARQFDLWGNEVTPFTTARERYGTWPTTVWPIDHSNPETLKLKAAIGDFGKAGDVSQTRDVVTGDSREVHVPPGWADFLITCPPYFNLERYNGPAGDLSMAPTYAAFCQDLLSVVYQTGKALKPGALSCWVVGLLRDDDGTLLPLHADVMRLHEESGGFSLLEEVVLSQVNNGALQRVGNFDKGQHHLIRTHEYLLVFRRKTPL